MQISDRIRHVKNTYSESSIEDNIATISGIAREINGCDVVLRIEEGMEDRYYSDLYPDEVFVIDMAKLSALDSSWRYLHHIFCSILHDMNDGKPTLAYESSHKYSIMDTLDREEIEAVKPDTLEGRKVISVIGDLTL